MLSTIIHGIIPWSDENLNTANTNALKVLKLQ